MTIALAVLLVGACGDDEPPPPEHGGDFKFGMAEALQVAWGLSELRSFQLIAYEYNKAGGLEVGGKKYTVKIPYYDHEYKGDVAAAACQRLIFEDNVKFMYIGGSGPALACAPILEQNGVLWNGGGTAKDIIGPHNDYSYRTMSTGQEISNGASQWIKANMPEVKTVAFLSVDDDVGHAYIQQFRRWFELQGMEVESDFVERGLKDFYPSLTRLLGKNPDLIAFMGVDRNDGYLQVKQVRELGWEGPILMEHPNPKELIEVAGFDAAQGVFGTGIAPEAAETELVPFAKLIRDRFQETYDTQPYSPAEFNMLWVYLQAIEKADSFDVDKVKAVMDTEEFDTAFGKSRFGGASFYGVDRQLLEPVFLVKIEGEELVHLGKYLSSDSRGGKR